MRATNKCTPPNNGFAAKRNEPSRATPWPHVVIASGHATVSGSLFVGTLLWGGNESFFLCS